MKSGIWKNLSLMIAAAGLSISATQSLATAQDNFREFDRKMVATPAELFEALSTFRPTEKRQQIEAARRSEIEEAGREFLSKLSPEQKEKAWEFAEKYLRKNGVDARSSQKLMEQFGLPVELQNELSEQFRDYGNRTSDSDTNSPRNREPDDAISEILRRAKNAFNSGSPDEVRDSGRANPLDSADRSKAEASGDQPDVREPKPDSNNDRQILKPKSSLPEQRSAGTPNQPDQKPKVEPNSQRDQRKRNANNNRTIPQTGDENDILQPMIPQASQANRANRDARVRRAEKRTQETQGKDNAAAEADLDRLLGQLEGLNKNDASKRKQGGNTSGTNPFSDANLDWEKVINDLAVKGTTTEGSKPSRGNDGSFDAAALDQAKKMLEEMASNDQIDQDKLEQARDMISRSIESQKQAESNGWGQWMPKTSASSEKLGTRFDRLLVKAAKRTLEADEDNQSVSKSVGSVFGNLLERIQNKNDEDKQTADRSSYERSRERDRNQSADRERETASTESDASSDSNRNSGSPSFDPTGTSKPQPRGGGLNPGKMLDNLPDLSGINPTHVFTFFAVVGFLFFMGYLLAQSVVGSEATVRKRKVVQQIRNTKIKSPKDLVETVDMFLLAKFGIKSSWWNAGLAQNVLKSKSPELQSRVDELIQDYVRARYMRDDIEIPAADQQRYKKTLEELSLLDIKPAKNLRFVPASQALVSPSSAEG